MYFFNNETTNMEVKVTILGK